MVSENTDHVIVHLATEVKIAAMKNKARVSSCFIVSKYRPAGCIGLLHGRASCIYSGCFLNCEVYVTIRNAVECVFNHKELVVYSFYL